ncbi:hypothetical protein B0H13DRAFT_2374494 [Mycena leptocephala]|nr:hypothetical protein B0H13DRAFT_2374494 [Mycena leptocephala]
MPCVRASSSSVGWLVLFATTYTHTYAICGYICAQPFTAVGVRALACGSDVGHAAVFCARGTGRRNTRLRYCASQPRTAPLPRGFRWLEPGRDAQSPRTATRSRGRGARGISGGVLSCRPRLGIVSRAHAGTAAVEAAMHSAANLRGWGTGAYAS